MSSILQATRQPELLGQRGGQVESLCCRAEIPRIIDKVARFMTEQLYAQKDIFAMRLALEEAVVNAVRHGNRDDPARRVIVSFLVGPERVLIDVHDEGDGFDPRTVPDPLAAENLERSSGRGLHLMRTYMTWVRFNARGNCVTMCKARERVEVAVKGER